MERRQEESAGKEPKRLCLFLLRREAGEPDRTTEIFVEGLVRVCERVILISAGAPPLTDAGGKLPRLETIYVPPADQAPSAAYRAALERMGWESLAEWEEVVLTGNAMLGPVFPLEEMFSRMREREVDFWGVSACGYWERGLAGGRAGERGIPYLPLDLIVFRKNVQKDFRKSWESLPDGASDSDGGVPEGYLLTKTLEASGYRWDSWLKTPEDGQWTADYLLMNPVQAIRDGRSPVFQRNSFLLPQMKSLCESAGEHPWELFRYLREETAYDTDLLMEHFIRSCHQDDVCRALRMTYVLPSRDCLPAAQRTGMKTALVMHLYYMDLLEESVRYAGAMPEDADFYLITTGEGNAERVRDAFSGIGNHIEVRVAENRGRDVGSLLVEAADLQDRYDLICFYHDKKTNHVWPHTAGQSFAYRLSECVLSSEAYVRNIISLFESNRFLGMLTGLTPNHGEFLSQLGTEWGPNYPISKKLAEELELRVPMAEDHIPAIGLGDVFWYRTKAMAPMFRKKWTYADFPEEPVGADGTILHAIERVYPFAVQEAGYLPGKVMPDHLAALEMDNLSFYVSEYNRQRLNAMIYGDIRAVTEQEKIRLDPGLYARALSANLPTQLRLWMKRHVPRGLYRGVLRVKRSIFGPKNVSLEEEEATDVLLTDPR